MKLGGTILVLALGLGGCSVYDYRYVYEPDPQEVSFSPEAGDGSVRAQVWVLGLRDRQVDVRVRIENESPAPVDFDPATLVLRAGDGTPFGGPIARPPEPQSVAPGSALLVEAAFGLPGEVHDVDWSGLSVEWNAGRGAPTRVTAAFTREPRAYYDRYPNRIGVGFQRFDTR